MSSVTVTKIYGLIWDFRDSIYSQHNNRIGCEKCVNESKMAAFGP